MKQDLQLSVISSSSLRPLRELVIELNRNAALNLVDLFIFRSADIAELRDAGVTTAGSATSLGIIVEPSNLQTIQSWIAEQLSSTGVQVSALATYFPTISSIDEPKRQQAINALVNTVLLARGLTEMGLMTSPVVETVAGTLVDSCDCSSCKKDHRVFPSKRGDKIQLLVDSLTEVHNQLAQKWPGGRYAIGVELEPGETYVINNDTAIEQFFARLDSNPSLGSVIGLNLDIAHMKIAGVTALWLKKFQHRLTHAHIADHPGMHTRDQIVGSWTDIFHPDGAYAPYIELLQARAAKPSDLPFSKAIALELEGCGRIQWIYNSLSSMRHIVAL